MQITAKTHKEYSGRFFHNDIVKQYGQSLKETWGEDNIWVWDSAGYTEEKIKGIYENYKWISRVLETLTDAKEMLEYADTEKMHSTTLNGYCIFITEMEYGGG